eukprot:CAMPEP_0194482152 /NCGR_PEP_ID=MMETSP0253-20130528/4236_1 /TAXON_ID=2966 /ORGANISM="Noctiluca scintillans" /LENGTH=667 /DNA_ID=CAMNT_0039321675 /DNA_START=23 /DNA_END=2026 /DNA_ORIENTATION=-
MTLAARIIIFLLSLWVSQGLVTRSVSSVLSSESDRPVTKVVDLLKKILDELNIEAREDSEVYKKLNCWCKNGDKETNKDIEDAQFQISDLTASIAQNTARSSALSTKSDQKKSELAASQKRLEEATIQREKQLAEFNENERDDLVSVESLKQAITVLGKHRSFMQVSHPDWVEAASKVQGVVDRRAASLIETFSASQTKLVSSFIQQPEASYAAHTGQSGQIVGMLEQMLSHIQSDLSEAQKQDARNAENFSKLKVSLEASIGELQTSLDNLISEKANTDAALVSDKEAIVATKETLSKENQYLMFLKEKCQTTDKEWEERQQTREAEIAAVEGAIKVLDADDAHQTFARAFSFLQTKSADQLRSKALSFLASKAQNSQFSQIATTLRLDSFSKVKAAIDKMVEDLLQEDKDEVALRDSCNSGLHDNGLSKDTTAHAIGNGNARAETLTEEIQTTEESISEANTKKSDVEAQVEKDGKARQADREKFEASLADHQETDRLLHQALGVLREFYEPVLLQKPQSVGPPPPPGFSVYKEDRSRGVIEMIQEIILDNSKAQKETEGDESFAQAEYLKEVERMTNEINAFEAQIMDLNKKKAGLETDLQDTQETLDGLSVEDQELDIAAAALHKKCDFLLKNFSTRKEARADEVKALRTVKSILSGADFGAE